MTFHALCEQLSTTPFSMLLQNITWIIPMTQSVHIVCIAIVIGSAAMIDLRILGVSGRSQSVSGMSNRLLPWIWVSLIILLATGAILAIAEPIRSLENPAFQAKMLMLGCAAFLTLYFQRALSTDHAFWELTPTRRVTAKMAAVVSLVLWIGIIFAGRWIAYMDIAFG